MHKDELEAAHRRIDPLERENKELKEREMAGPGTVGPHPYRTPGREVKEKRLTMDEMLIALAEKVMRLSDWKLLDCISGRKFRLSESTAIWDDHEYGEKYCSIKLQYYNETFSSSPCEAGDRLRACWNRIDKERRRLQVEQCVIDAEDFFMRV